MSEAKEARSDALTAKPVVLVEDLAFTKARLSLLQPDITDAVSKKRSQDRTTDIVRRWKVLTDNMSMIRSQTLTTLEASEGKGGTVTLRIFDRPKFDAIKQSIRNQEEQICVLERCIRQLDALHCGFLDELQATRSSLAGVEGQQRQLLNTFATSALQRGGANRRQGPEAILAADQLYQQKKTQVESQIVTAKKGLDELMPKIEKIEEILSSCRC